MRAAMVAALTAVLAGCATTSEPQSTWQAIQTSDPMTGAERCTVTAPDRSFGRGYTRTGYLYPFVERNSEAGLLVGVMSGGNVRVPPGDIQWRVDGHEMRTLRASRTPVIGDGPRAIFNAGLMSSIRNGITAVDGEQAQEILAEMANGSSLLYRASASANMAGIPSRSAMAMGQITESGARPFALDASFHAALRDCGISVSAVENDAPDPH